jgi:hypothetical protein
MEFVNFPRNQQQIFLKTIKRTTRLTWNKLSKILNVNRSMIYFYLSEYSKLPYSHYLALCKLAKMEANPKIPIIAIKNRTETIPLPELNDTLAEFLGALAGDGHLNKVTYEISISMDKDLDKQYSQYILKLYKQLFGICARTYVQKTSNKIKCFAYSQDLVNQLSKIYNLPIGKKKGNLHIPEQIKTNKNLLRSYIRGLFDTDGSIHRHHTNTAMIEIVSRDPIFIQEIKQAVTNLGFTSSLSNKNLYIYRQKEITKFFNEIKPANPKHIYKYEYYIKYQRVPLTSELVNR